jgi:Na+/melibiose symporter-like transporter
MVKQTEEALSGINLLLSIIPVIFIAAGTVFLFFYPINREFHKKISGILPKSEAAKLKKGQ